MHIGCLSFFFTYSIKLANQMLLSEFNRYLSSLNLEDSCDMTITKPNTSIIHTQCIWHPLFNWNTLCGKCYSRQSLKSNLLIILWQWCSPSWYLICAIMIFQKRTSIHHIILSWWDHLLQLNPSKECYKKIRKL
jgi:hypothetical protein